MSPTILKVEGLTLATDRGTLVENLSFQISAGEIVALTGKSGSGKTSIALSVLDLRPPGLLLREGMIQWSAQPEHTMTLPADSRKWHSLRGTHIGYTQQDIFGAFDPVMKMGDQIFMIVRERISNPDTDIERDLRIKMEEVGLHETDRLLDSYPHQLSGGQLQRCQIAMAVVIRPALLITDEPTSAIDKINQLELLDVFAMLRDKYNMAILCITHEEAVVRHLADREVRLDSITPEFPLPLPMEMQQEIDSRAIILAVSGLIYTHSYGGMMHQKGASVGSLDFAVHRGACLGIVGESGSGKSTLAQLLVGLFVPMQGEIALDGKVIDFHRINDLTLLRSKVQLVMQDGRGSLHPNFSVREILAEIRDLRQSSGEVTCPDLPVILRDVGLEEFVLDRKAGQLSGGECLRVSIARALLMQPEVLICDESTSSLDGHTRDGIVELLLHLMREHGLALILISHDERIIRGVADQVLVLAEGKVVEKGPAAQVINYPTHPVTRKIFSLHATLEHKRRL